MRIRNGRNLASILAGTNRIGYGRNGEEDLRFHSQKDKQVAAAASKPPPAALCEVNRWAWDVTPIVLAFFHLDPCHTDLQEGSKEASGGHDGSASDPLRRSSLPAAVRRRKVGKVEGGKGSETNNVCPNSDDAQLDSAVPPAITTIKRERIPTGAAKTKKTKRASNGSSRTYCKRKDGKGWRCGKLAKAGSSLCDHHLSQLRSYYNPKKYEDEDRETIDIIGGGNRKRRSSSSSAPSSMKTVDNDCYYYYYYSGFGPGWREAKRKQRPSAIAKDVGTHVGNDDYIDEDENGQEEGEEEEEDGSTRKTNRGRADEMQIFEVSLMN